MRSAILARRGAFGPAILAAALCAAACAVASDLQLDLARPVPLAEYQSKLLSLQRCEGGSLEIAYSFGELQLTPMPKQTACVIQVSVGGELGEEASPQRFWCDGEIIARIDWLNDAAGKRQHPPLQELREQRGCKLHVD